eukprot:TRINITY_DN515_c0_g1_i1.p1 TRINITY_DN515_c0_g1~~TRINITY_DN515_c0_g1_i1.p1  ORF type:complete len:337 (-),score=87.60 TRINITY_DN515_c0_g1_i1:61-1071(-)
MCFSWTVLCLGLTTSCRLVTGQFAAVPLNLLGNKKQADYLNTGFWSQRAMKEAARFCDVRLAYDGTGDKFTKLPPASTWDISPDSAYVHVCANETIHGVELLEDPVLPAGSPPLVADFTSTLLSRPVDVSKYGLIYASGGKNLGPAGFTVVIVRDDLLNRASPLCPSVLSYKLSAESKPISSLYNTPPTYLIYMCGLVLQDLKDLGGLGAVQKRVHRRSDQIYSLIEASNSFYTLKNVDKPVRSMMNIPFRVKDGLVDGLEEAFCRESETSGIYQLFCHPLFPGLRVTLYNGVPDEAIDALYRFMIKFMADHGGDADRCTVPRHAPQVIPNRHALC